MERPNSSFVQRLAAVLMLVVAMTVSGAEPRVFLLDAKHLAATQQRIRDGDKSFAPALEALEKDAGKLLKTKPVSVMDKSVTPPSGDKHDYMSQAPYFWPNPATSNGLPYIRRDGERNPEINKIPDHGNILGMPEKVETLALAYYFTGDEADAVKAVEFLRVWFLNPATLMNPHFKFAQAIPGVNTGRGIGLIESRGLVKVVDSTGLLAGSKAWTESDQRGLEKWFEEFLRWMRESDYGQDEAAAKNNHGTYYDVQVVSFALFLGQTNQALEVVKSAHATAVQIEPDGQQPLETARTKGWSYSTANLSGLMSLSSLGECVGVDLWNYETADGRGIRKAFDYLTPFGFGEQKWPHQQLGGWSSEGSPFLARMAATKFPAKSYLELAAKTVRSNPADRENLLWPKLNLIQPTKR